MLQSFKCFWNGNKIFPGSYTELGVVPPASSASKTSPPSRLHINDGSPFAMDCTSTRSSRTTSSLSPISSPSRQNSISSLSPRLRSRSDDESMNEEAQVVPQNTTVTTVENNQEITTTTKTATTFTKTIVIQPSSDDGSSVKKRQESIPSSCHSLVTPTRIPQPMIINIPLFVTRHSTHKLLGRRRSASVKTMLATIPEHESGVVDEQLRSPSFVCSEAPSSSPFRKTMFKETMRR